MDPEDYGRPISKKRRLESSEKSYLGHVKDLSDRQLVDLSVRDLNRVVSNLPPQQIKLLKYKRRTLKNRGYASNCRVKRLSQKEQLALEKKKISMENEVIRRENEALREELERLKAESRALIEFQKQNFVMI